MKKTNRTVAFFLMLIMLSASISLILPLTASAAESTSFEVKIVHTNDIHGRVVENEAEGIIGMERLKRMADAFFVGADMDLMLDSGDIFHGQPIATLTKGDSIASLMKSCGYDAMTVGNHDWSYGADKLKQLGTAADVAILAGNVEKDEGGKLFDGEYYTETITKGGQTLKVGIFGMIDADLYGSTTPSNVAGLTFTDIEIYANAAVEALKADGCQVIIALSHSNNPAELARYIEGVDLWLCGHEHVELNTTALTPYGNTAYVVENESYLTSAGLITLKCDMDASGNVTVNFERTAADYNTAKAYEKDASVTAILNGIKEAEQGKLGEKVGSISMNLDGDPSNVRVGETNLGKAVVGAYLLATGADVAIERVEHIHASIGAGDVTYGDILGVNGDGDYIVTKRVTGMMLTMILEEMIEIQIQNKSVLAADTEPVWSPYSGSYLQTAGMTVEYDPVQPKGSRVFSVKIGEEMVDLDTYYVLATSSRTAVSGRYEVLQRAEENGQFCAFEEAMSAFFAQDEQKILSALENGSLIVYEPEVDHSGDEVPKDHTTIWIVVSIVAAVAVIGGAVATILVKRHKKKQAEEKRAEKKKQKKHKH